MPQKLRAGSTFDYVLVSDRDAEPKPTFKLRVLSCDAYDQLQQITLSYQAADKLQKPALLHEALTLVCDGWKNIDGEFSVDALKQLLTPRECWELIGDATLEAVLSPDERKKYESQPK